jgi:hypothetical protein
MGSRRKGEVKDLTDIEISGHLLDMHRGLQEFVYNVDEKLRVNLSVL